MQTLTMNIKRCCFDCMGDGRKRVEYRDMNPFRQQRSEGLQTPFRLRLLNGMLPPVPEAIVEVKRVVRDRASQQYQLHLGRVLRRRNWNRKTSAPR